LFYSSIITTAAVADVEFKSRRRKQWDVVIAEAERSLSTEVNRSEAPLTSVPPSTEGADLSEQVGGANLDLEESPTLHSEEVIEGQEEIVQSWVEHVELGAPNSSFGENVELTTSKAHGALESVYYTSADSKSLQNFKIEALKSFNPTYQRPIASFETQARVSSNSIYASEFRRTRKDYFWTPKKLVTMELSIAKLATRLMLEIQRDVSSGDEEESFYGDTELSDAPNRDDSRATLTDVSSRLKRIVHSEAFNLAGIERLQYPQYTPNLDPTIEAALELNQALRTIFRKCALGVMSLEQTIAKISYNLLVSPVPPDVKTYTILISRLSRLGHHGMVDIVIESFFETHTRPNEMTINAILTHYERKNDPRGFDWFVLKMKGFNGGLMLARPDIPTEGVGASRLRRWGAKVIQRMTLDPSMFFSLIKGCLTFGRLDQAVRWYKLMRKQNMIPGVPLLTAFLSYFAKRCDWDRGIGMWHRIKSIVLHEGSNGFTESSPMEAAFFHVLQLCKNCAKSSEFKIIYEEALRRGLTMDRLLIRTKVRRGFTYEDDERQRMKRKTSILEYRVQLISNDIHEWALQILASKMVLSGYALEDVERLFLKHKHDAYYQAWLKERAYLQPTRKRRRPDTTTEGHGSAPSNTYSVKAEQSAQNVPSASKPSIDVSTAGGTIPLAENSSHHVPDRLGLG